MPRTEVLGSQVQGLRGIVLIDDLKKQGLSLTAIARKVGCGQKYLERALERPNMAHASHVPSEVTTGATYRGILSFKAYPLRSGNT